MLLAASFRTAFRHGSDVEARSKTTLAATFAGMGFRNWACTSRTPTPTRSRAW